MSDCNFVVWTFSLAYKNFNVLASDKNKPLTGTDANELSFEQLSITLRKKLLDLTPATMTLQRFPPCHECSELRVIGLLSSGPGT